MEDCCTLGLGNATKNIKQKCKLSLNKNISKSNKEYYLGNYLSFNLFIMVIAVLYLGKRIENHSI
jgi:hypothetical protein